MRIAVIGSGIAGLAAARRLSAGHQVTLFERDDRAGGHAHTVDVTLDRQSHPVDTGFLVLNERTYPNLLALFDELDVDLARSDMSFSASIRPAGVEWCGSTLSSLFAQPANLANPRFLRMVADIFRFNREATRLALQMDGDGAASAAGSALREPLGTWLARNRYGHGFRNWYLLPMAAAIWSCPMRTMREFPVGSFVRFFHNHGLLQVRNRPQWFTVAGGSRRYVDKIIAALPDVRLGTPVTGVSRARLATTGKVDVRTAAGTEEFDAVILATHSAQSLALLEDPDQDEASHLAAIPYQPNAAWLHTDPALMPRRRAAWAAWNYVAQDANRTVAGGARGHVARNDASDDRGPAARVRSADEDLLFAEHSRVCVTYWLQRLQPLPFETPLFLTLNPIQEPASEHVIQRIDYEHPVFGENAMAAQLALDARQGQRATWYAGAWLGYGFHEDGLVSGNTVAERIESLNAMRTLRRAA